MTSTAVARWN